MTICQHPECPASKPNDQFERPMSVEHGKITFSVLGAVGHHILNRQQDGTINAHLNGWKPPQFERAIKDVRAERQRVERYLRALKTTESVLEIRRELLVNPPKTD